MKVSTFLKPLSFIPALALMYMIFIFSSQTGDQSSMLSYKVSHAIVETVNTVTGQGWDEWKVESYSDKLNGVVRKGAHITEFFLLAVAVSFPLYVYGVRGILLLLLAGAICVAYAFGDEYHQSMVSGRSSSTRDVGIDSIGIFFGIILTRLIGWSGRMAITGPAYERRQNRRERELDEREAELTRREDELRRREYGSRQQARSYPQNVHDIPFQDHQQTRVAGARHAADDRTRVIGTSHEVDGRARISRSEQEQRRLDEEYRRRRAQRQKLQSQKLAEDSTSDELSDDLPLSGLFKGRKNRRSE